MEDIITITTPVPLEMDQIRNLYENREKVHFLLDYENSQIKDQGFLFYVGNLEIPGDINFNLKTKDKLSLLREYMILPNLIELNTLNHATMQVVLRRKNVDMTGMFASTALDDDEIDLFISENEELVDRWIIFLDSMYVYALYTIYLQDQIGEEQNENIVAELVKANPIRQMVPEKMDPTFVSPNFVFLIQTPSFFESYFSVDVNLDETYFFTYQFTEYCYKGMNLFYYFTQKENWLLAAALVLLDRSVGVPDETTNN